MDKVFSMVGLATRAGKTVSGEFSVEKAIRQKKAKLVIVSEEASDNTKNLFYHKCEFYQIPYTNYGSKTDLGSATGNASRTSIAILDSEFSKSIIESLNSKQTEVVKWQR